MPNPRVHFENQSSDSTEHIVEEQQSEGEDDNKRLDWNQRHSILSRLSPLIMNNRHSTEELENRYSRMVEGTGDGMLSSELGYLIEYADLRLADAKHSDNNNQRAHGKGGQNKHPKPLSKVEIKLLNRVVDDCRFDRSDDFVVVKTISRSETGKVELVRSKLSSIERLNQTNLFILKSIPKSSAIRMRQYISVESELSVLLKLSKETLEKFMSQPKDSKERSDPIPKLYSSFQSETDLNLLLEFLPNGSLSDFILTNRPSLNSLTGEDLMRVWFAELVLALDWLHRVSGFVHRDFKPSNVLVDGNGHLVLNDFGCSTKLYRHSSSTVKSKHHNNSSNDTVEEPEGFLIDRYISRLKNQRVFYRFDPLLVSNSSCKVLVGTCDYISPEMLDCHLNRVLVNQDSDDEDSDTEREDQRAEDEGLGPYGNEIDFWSLGISIYEIIYGQPTFFCQSISETYDKIVSHPEHLVVPKCRNSLVELDSELECDDQIVSDELRHLIKSLLTTRDVRIGCGKDGVEDFKRHSFFKGLDWNSLRSYRLNDFKAVPIEIDYNQKSSHQSMNDTGKFNFSNFFNNSSPGLSILKDSRNQLKEQSSNEAEMVQGKKGNFESRLQKSCNDDKDEQRRLFSGFTHLPSLPNQFDLIDQEEKYLIINQLKSSLKSSTASSISTSSINSTNQRRSSIKKSNYCDDYRFVTPIRVVPGTSRYDRRGSVGSSSSGINNNGEQQRSFHNSNYNTQLCGSSSNRKRRINEELRVPMSQFEELTRLIDHVQLTAKKSRQTARGCFERSDDKIISRIGQIDFSRIDERRDMVDDECLEERVEVNNDNSLCEDVLDGDKNRSDEDKGEVYERLENRCKSLIRKVDRLICRSEEFYDKVSKTDF